MTSKSYGLFCPLAMACEVLEPRWTLLILEEMWCGSTRFNEIRRGVPGISPTLLSKRLKEMEERGLIERLEDRAKGTVDYIRTPLAIELEPALLALGDWAYNNIKAEIALDDVNPDYLMWNLRRAINQSKLPERRLVVRFHFTDLKQGQASYWLITKPGMPVDLCMTDPGFDVDLFVETASKTMASVWMGYTSLSGAISSDRILLIGDAQLTRTIGRWLVKPNVAAVKD